jgi:hypothetical protein
LNKNAYLTPIQKFTCNVRTKFVDFAYSIFTDIPEVYDPKKSGSVTKMFTTTIRLILNGESGKKKSGSTLPTTTDNVKSAWRAVLIMIHELVERLRSFLDFIEPLHVRRLFPVSSQLWVLWSYYLSIFKWEKEISSSCPSLKDDLYSHRFFHLHILRPSFLRLLDHMDILGDYFQVALWLNVWYEALLAMDKNAIISSSAKDHLQSSLADRILHIYRSLFPTGTAGKPSRRKELEDRAKQLSLFPSTAGLLPSRYRHLPMGNVAQGILRQQKTSIRSDENLPLENADPHCQKPPKHPFPMLKAYVPAQLFVILGLDTETQNSSTDTYWMEPVEVRIRKHLNTYDAKVQSEILDFSPYIMSIGTKAVFDNVNRMLAEQGLDHQVLALWDSEGRALLHWIVRLSISYCTMLIESLELWSSLQKTEVTLAEFVMENRDLGDKYFQVLADDSESFRTRAVSVMVSWASTLG